MKNIIKSVVVANALFCPLVWSEEMVGINSVGAYSLEAVKVVMSLALVLLLFYLGVTLFKKYMGGAYKGSSSIKVLGGLSLGNKEKLVLVEAGNVNLLLGVSSAGVNKLHCFKNEELTKHVEEEIEARSFNQQLKNIMNKI